MVVMGYVVFLIILAVLEESNTVSPDILKYDQYMKDFEATGRQLKQEAKDKKIDGLVMKRENEFDSMEIDYTQIEDNESSEKNFTYEVDELEKMFLDLHPNIKNITWREVENLTPEMHKKICDQVLYQIEDDYQENNYTFIDVPIHRIKSERIMTDPLLIMENDVAHVTVLVCVYNKKRFFITKADDNNVFQLRLSRGTEIFDFQSGLHPVNYNLSSYNSVSTTNLTHV